jgi:CysZ protein
LLEEIIIAIKAYFKAHDFIIKNKLWKWILIPGIIYTILFAFGIYIFSQSSGHVIDYFFSKTGLKIWLQREHEGWLRFIFIFGQLILQVILMLFYFSWFKYLFLIMGAPVFAWLSEKTETTIEGTGTPFNSKKFSDDILRGIQIAWRNSLWQTLYLISILFLSLVPVIGWASPVLAIFVECYYFGFSMLDYTSARRDLSSSESIDFIGGHKGLAIGNGMIFFIMHAVPFLAPGYAIIAATLSLQKNEN